MRSFVVNRLGSLDAAAAKQRIDAAATAAAAALEAVRGKQFIVFHDAYQYFETRFDMPSAGAISLSDARKPSPARIAEIRDHVRANDIRCVFAEPQFDPGIVSAVSDGAKVRSGVMDPLGAAHRPGPAFYAALLGDLATAMADCLSDLSDCASAGGADSLRERRRRFRPQPIAGALA